jgi:hypothetical protein
MTMAEDLDRPAIDIALLPEDGTTLPERLQPLLLGIEEEQIPFLFLTSSDQTSPDLVTRAYDAAVASRLSVGIAYSHDQIVVHYKNLAPDATLFTEDVTTAKAIRIIGANAARLVKGVPFKL